MKEKRLETDLYKPVYNYFYKKGYEVYAEVHHCDVTAVKNNELVIIELKRHLSIELLVQATKRQRITDLVYIAIPKPNYSLKSKKWKDICAFIRRLELGLIIVHFLKNRSRAEIIIEPSSFDRKKSMQYHKKNRESILKEIQGRHADYNVGGSNKAKIMTAYKENCIQIASYLERIGPMSPKALREMGTGPKTQSILSQNHYGWFEKVERGVYKISSNGVEQIKQYPQIITHYEGQIESGQMNTVR